MVPNLYEKTLQEQQNRENKDRQKQQAIDRMRSNGTYNKTKERQLNRNYNIVDYSNGMFDHFK